MADPTPVQSPAPLSTWLGVVLLFALFGVIALAIIGPAPRGDTYERKRAEERMKKLQAAREEDAKALGDYAWIDKNKGTVRLPIQRAMELTVADLAKKKPTQAGPIATPEGSPAPGGAAVATPPPSPSASALATGTPKPTSVAGQNSNAGGQPAAAVNPPAVEPKTQPGAGASPASTKAPPGSPLPARGATASPSP